MPPWNHIHPALVHFPIALLTVAPLLVLVGLLWPAQRRGIHASALALLVLGVAGLFLAMESGEAVERYARATPALLAGVREHELLAQKTTLVFGMLALAFAVLWGLPLLRKRELTRPLELGLMFVWLLLSAGGVLALGLTGHAGGHLVHDLHTHAGPEPPLR
ncbi:MAG: hypothetical protein IPP58_02400 [Holophagaceae bacterium]|uniref:DUF2231 domain-containing protein n=1 Tax=Candidatus Geothrix skivensis TaxID=2954439 RepID=A0A9D7SEQ5_9BACT|nr:hypothetical protein [Candidatus Geothrix skivensis]